MRGCGRFSLLRCYLHLSTAAAGMMWMPGERQSWYKGGAVAHGLTLSLAIIQALIFCLASGTPLGSSGDSEAMRGDQQHSQQGRRPTMQHPDARESPFHVAVPSTDPASAAPEQVHISFASSGSLEQYAVTVAWSTWPETRSQVAWGSSHQEQDNVAYGSSTCEATPHKLPRSVLRSTAVVYIPG